MYYIENKTMTKEKSQQLTKAFRQLRKLGYFAKRKLACCRSCAYYEIPDDKQNLYVYTSYNEEQLKKEGIDYLYWSAPNDDASEIIKVLKANNIKATWNKDPNTAIKIDLN